jgi:hypothetical protein
VSYNTMKTDFLNILDRDEIQPTGPQAALADTFMQQAIARIQRDCRLPSMERSLLITPTAAPMIQFPVPTDLIQIIDVLVPMETSTVGQLRPLKRVAYRKLVEYDQTDIPRVYARWQTQVYLAGAVTAGSTLQFLYYGNFSAFATPDSDNELSASTPDLAVYAALSYAGDYFEHPLAGQWEARFQQIKAEVQQMAMDLENEGGVAVVEPIYQPDYDWELP